MTLNRIIDDYLMRKHPHCESILMISVQMCSGIKTYRIQCDWLSQQWGLSMALWAWQEHIFNFLSALSSSALNIIQILASEFHCNIYTLI